MWAFDFVSAMIGLLFMATLFWVALEKDKKLMCKRCQKILTREN